MNESPYLPLMRVQVQHGYFEPGRTRHMAFDPSEQTWHLMRRFDVLMRCDGQSMVLHVRDDQLPGLRTECAEVGGALHFQLRSTDPACAQYTAPLPPGQLPTFAPDPGQGSRLVAQTGQGTREPMVAATTVLGELMLPMEVGKTADSGPAAEAEGRPNPTVPKMAWTLNVEARSTIWKYWLLGDWLDRDLQLVDLAGEIDFAPPVSEALPDGRIAKVIRSRTAIAVQERSPHRFQLRDACSTPSKVLVPRMPTATPGGLGREWQSDDTKWVSEIFVSR